MALKAVISKEDFEKLPEVLQKEYTEGEGGKYFLDADDIDSHPKVAGLKSAFEKTKREAKDLRDAAKKFEGIDPDKYSELMEAAAKKEEDAAKQKGDFDQLRQRLEDTHRKEMEKVNKQIERRDAAIRKLVVENKLNAAIESAKVLEKYRPAVKAMLRERNIQVVEEGDEFVGVFKTDLGDIPVDQYVAEWAKTDEASIYLAGDNKGGSGTPPAGGTNTRKSSSTFNRSDPLAWGQNAEAVIKGEVIPS